MFYSLIFDIYKQHQKRFNDFFLQVGFYWIAFLLDKYAITVLEFNRPAIPFLIFFILFLSARTIIRYKKAQNLFGSFASDKKPYWAIFLAINSWVAYMVLVRWRIR